MTDHTHTSSTGPAWASAPDPFAALMKLLEPITRAQETDEPSPLDVELNVSDWVPPGEVLVIDGDEGRPPEWPRPEWAPRWMVMIHPCDVRGKDARWRVEFSMVAVREAIRKRRAHDKQWHPYPWGQR